METEKHILSDFVEGEPGFRAEPWYNPYGDCIEYRSVNEGIVADRIDGLLTIYRSALSDKAIGFQVKGVRAIVEKFGWLGVAGMSTQTRNGEIKSISVGFLVGVAYFQEPETPQRREAYQELVPLLPTQAEVPLEEMSVAP